jgi:hypothetical protein
MGPKPADEIARDIVEEHFGLICEALANECESLSSDMLFVLENPKAADAAEAVAKSLRDLIRAGKDGEL